MRPTRRQFALGLGAASAFGSLGSASGFATRPQETSASEPLTAERVVPKLAATLILVRHSEKAKGGSRSDPELSEAGHRRAEAFARMFENAGITSLIHTEYKRTRDTLAPLAERLDLESETVGAREFEALMERLAAAGPDEVIAVAGHSNTIPHIAWRFGCDLPGLKSVELEPPIEYGYLRSETYDRVHVLTPGVGDGPTAPARLLDLHYGEPSGK